MKTVPTLMMFQCGGKTDKKVVMKCDRLYEEKILKPYSGVSTSGM